MDPDPYIHSQKEKVKGLIHKSKIKALMCFPCSNIKKNKIKRKGFFYIPCGVNRRWQKKVFTDEGFKGWIGVFQEEKEETNARNCEKACWWVGGMGRRGLHIIQSSFSVEQGRAECWEMSMKNCDGPQPLCWLRFVKCLRFEIISH